MARLLALHSPQSRQTPSSRTLSSAFLPFMMNFAGEPVRWKPLDHGIGIEECSIDFFRRRAQHAMKTNGICGHDCSFRFGSCESHYRGLPFFGWPLSRLCGLVERRRAGSTLPHKQCESGSITSSDYREREESKGTIRRPTVPGTTSRKSEADQEKTAPPH